MVPAVFFSGLTGENYCCAFHEVYGLPAVALRYFNVFGPCQDPASEYSAVIPKFITALLRGEPPAIHGDGLQSRDSVFVANVAQANLSACRCDQAMGQVINVACGQRYTLLDLYHDLAEVIGTALEPVFIQLRTGDVRHYDVLRRRLVSAVKVCYNSYIEF